MNDTANKQHHLTYGSSASSSIQPDFNFAAVGDWGCHSSTRNTVNNIIDKSPELIIGLGDHSYEDTIDCWLSTVDRIDEKIKIVFGNHDVKSDLKINQYMNHFNLTKQYYSFNYQNIHFLILSSEFPFESDSVQYMFVKNDLARVASDPKIDWVVVSYHQPSYSSPTRHPAATTVRDTYHPLFEEYGVDLVLQAHNHFYERSHPLSYNNVDSSRPKITDTDIKDKNYTDPKGQIFATVGTGGESLDISPNKVDYMITHYEGHGFLNIDVINRGVTTIFNATFFANDGMIKDHFIISKQS